MVNLREHITSIKECWPLLPIICPAALLCINSGSRKQGEGWRSAMRQSSGAKPPHTSRTATNNCGDWHVRDQEERRYTNWHVSTSTSGSGISTQTGLPFMDNQHRGVLRSS